MFSCPFSLRGLSPPPSPFRRFAFVLFQPLFAQSCIQLALFEDYRTNPQRYPQWQAYLRQYQPPLLAVWGKNDPIFGPAGAEAFKHDLPHCEVHLLDTGHFALEEDAEVIAEHITRFLTAQRAP